MNNLLSVNTLLLCTGASTTFVSYSGEYTSLIDHILIRMEKVDLVLTCKVPDDDTLNISSHRPILMHFEIFLSNRRASICPPQILLSGVV